MQEIATIELSELSRRTALLMPSLSRIVRELELRGYMHKSADQRDLRRILATLTARGRLLVETISPECDAVHVAINKAMGGDKMLKLHELLADLERRIAALDIRRADSQAVDAELEPLAPARQRGRPRKTVSGGVGGPPGAPSAGYHAAWATRSLARKYGLRRRRCAGRWVPHRAAAYRRA